MIHPIRICPVRNGAYLLVTLHLLRRHMYRHHSADPDESKYQFRPIDACAVWRTIFFNKRSDYIKEAIRRVKQCRNL